MEKKVDAIYDQDSRRYHRFLIDSNAEGIVGNIYVSKEKPVPDEIIIQLKTKGDKNGK